MKHATLADLKEIYRQFQKRKDVFPHVRRDKLKKMIEKSLVIWQDGGVITYQQYKKNTRVGHLDIPAGSIMLHQILNSQQFSGKGSEVFDQFVSEVVGPSGGDLYLSVRKENTVACAFYEGDGMHVVGRVAWSGGSLPGLVYGLAVGYVTYLRNQSDSENSRNSAVIRRHVRMARNASKRRIR